MEKKIPPKSNRTIIETRRKLIHLTHTHDIQLSVISTET